MSVPVPRWLGGDKYVIWYLWFSAVLLCSLVVAVVLLVFQNQARITTQNRNNIAQCQASNVSREQDIAIWNRLLKIGPAAPAAQRAEAADLERLVKVKDTPRDCAAAFSGG